MSFPINSANALNSKEFNFGDVSVYGLGGEGVNLTITVGQPIFTSNSTIIFFTLTILEPFSAQGETVKPSDYFVNRETLDVYLLSGVLLDYNRSRLIDTLWVNWGNSLNATHVQEEKILYSQMHRVNFTKLNNSYFGTSTLPKLSEGSHNATIWVRAEHDEVTTYIPFWSAFSKTITFTVDTVAPKILMLAPKDSTYKTPEVFLNFTVNEQLSEIWYCLDGQSNITIVENTTLTGLRNGYHNVTVYARDKAGNTGVSENFFFNVNAPASFPFVSVVAVSVVAVALAVAAGLLVYHKKHKHNLVKKV
jgi:hypothetical protein